VSLGCDPKTFEVTSRGTPFHFLARSQGFVDPHVNLIPLMDSLIEWGVDIYTRDTRGRTPLMEVCANDDHTDPQDLLDLFLERVDRSKMTEYINALDNEGKSALEHAMDCMQPGVVALRLLMLSADPFIGLDPTGTNLFFGLVRAAVQEQRWENIGAIRMLVQRGFDFHGRNESGQTLLHILFEEPHRKPPVHDFKAMVQYMIDMGADSRADDASYVGMRQRSIGLFHGDPWFPYRSGRKSRRPNCVCQQSRQ